MTLCLNWTAFCHSLYVGTSDENISNIYKNTTEQWYKYYKINDCIQRIKTFDKKEFLKQKEKKIINKVLLILTYNNTLSSLKKVITNNCLSNSD